MKRTGIIGGSGYIGSYITKLFLENDYKVKASVRDLSKQEKYRHLKQLPNALNLEISELDTEDQESIKEFVPGCDILIHSGTPFQLDVDEPQRELFDPIINGTENFLNVIKKEESVEKVVIIASVAAYNTSFPLPADDKNVDHLYTENDPPFMHEDNHPYSQAKFYADQIVQEFLEMNTDLGCEIVSVYPTFAVGKSLSDRQDSTSVGMQYLFKNYLAPNPFMEMLFEQDVEFALVDVNDIAKSIFRIASLDGLHGKQYILSSDSWKVSDISRMLNNEKPADKARTVYSNSLAVNDLGVEFTSPSISLNQFEY